MTKLDDFFKLSKFNDYVESINKNTIFDKEIFQQMLINTKKVYENEKFLANLIDVLQNDKSILNDFIIKHLFKKRFSTEKNLYSFLKNNKDGIGNFN